MEDVEKLKKEIIRLIDEAYDPIYKQAFYSDTEVQRIMEKLFQKWKEGGERGLPIDYASLEDLKILYKVAKNVSSKRPEELYSAYTRVPGK